jgi:small-conductance mechanosensitive channel
VYIALALLRRLLVHRLGAMAARTATHIDDVAVGVVRRTRPYFLFIVALQAAARIVTPDERVAAVLNAISVVVVLLQLGVWGNGLIGFGVEHYARMRGEGDSGTRATIQAMGYAARFVLWALLVVTTLDHFGIQVTALITGLGIGGIAIALAVQNILGDLFAALSIVLDKPFVVGDFIIVDNVLGTVEHVGLKTTRIRSLSGEQVIVSNNDLLKSRIRNYKRMEQRRIVFQLDVTYDTAPEKMNRIPGIIREVIESQELTRFDRSHFMTFAESSLRVETVYFVLAPDYNKYADTQHAINVELLRRFNAEGIEFAFPTRTLYHMNDGQAAVSTT